ncbi:hypothetical protein EVAR_101348_1 [Eumeta japonica]|uniref:Uncharacterized protein n=1 Tax=Eumeta variegata TaxID=151549 RepID=A0A4C1SHI1_EUMVA|nr:hypothetical protein EVAR_101348_1 [Eumeta japonica]
MMVATPPVTKRAKIAPIPVNESDVLPKHQRPLTHYLPIFSPDLDLRQHIESAGHQMRYARMFCRLHLMQRTIDEVYLDHLNVSKSGHPTVHLLLRLKTQLSTSGSIRCCSQNMD